MTVAVDLTYTVASPPERKARTDDLSRLAVTRIESVSFGTGVATLQFEGRIAPSAIVWAKTLCLVTGAESEGRRTRYLSVDNTRLLASASIRRVYRRAVRTAYPGDRQ